MGAIALTKQYNKKQIKSVGEGTAEEPNAIQVRGPNGHSKWMNVSPEQLKQISKILQS